MRLLSLPRSKGETLEEPRKYVILGEMMDEIAQRREVRGPEEISEYVWKKARYDKSTESMFEYMHG